MNDKFVENILKDVTNEEIEEAFAESARDEIAKIIDWESNNGHNKLVTVHYSFEDFSDRYLREFIDFVNWKNVSYNGKMSLDFMREFFDKLDWNLLSFNRFIKHEDLDILYQYYIHIHPEEAPYMF